METGNEGGTALDRDECGKHSYSTHLMQYSTGNLSFGRGKLETDKEQHHI